MKHIIPEMKIGERIKILREWQGIGQRELARKAGCTAAALCQYEAGKRIPTLKCFRGLCKALGVRYEVLLGCDLELEESEVEGG